MNGEKRNRSTGVVAAIILAIAVLGVLVFMRSRGAGGRGGEGGSPATGSVTIRVGWMTSWADAGRVVESLIHTDIPKRNGVNIAFRSFFFGPPMNEAALAGDVDVTVVGDMPALALLAASDDWSVICRTLYFPYGLLVGKHVTARDVAGLKGMKIGVGFGTGPQPTLYRWLEEAGLDLKSDVTLVNLLPQEMAEAFRANRVDAIIIWEPTLSLLESSFGGRVLREAVGVGFMCVRNSIIAQHPDAVRAYITSWREGILYASQHVEETKALYARDCGLPVDLLGKIRIVDQNLSARHLNDVDVRLTEEDIAKNQRKADFAFEQGLLKRRVDVGARVNQSFVRPQE